MVDIFNSKIKKYINYFSVSISKNKPKKLLNLKERITTGIITFIKNRKKLFSKLKSKSLNVLKILLP